MSQAMSGTECLRVLADEITDQPVVVAVGGLIDGWHDAKPRALNYFSGGMGLASSIGLGLSLARPDRRVVVLDGDGGLLMNLGALATVSGIKRPNLLHLVFNNGTYESSGNFPLPGGANVRFRDIAAATGIRDAREVADIDTWRSLAPELLASKDHILVVLKVSKSDPVPFMNGNKLALRFQFQEALLQ
jgi:thiamine pyrophosphate-dependent acetolactate synthase large subunit-like protein